MKEQERFYDVLYSVSARTREVLERLPNTIKRGTTEIRMRAGLPLAVTVENETVFVRQNGQVQFHISSDLFTISKEDLEESFKKLCNNSVFAHENELKNGYIVMKNGSRAGVCGSISENGSFKDISSVNIRIAHEIFGCANEIVKNYKEGGLLIAGAPGSGKTTVLRDLIRQLSNGVHGKYYRISVIDSRCEISGSSYGKNTNNLGSNTDVLITEQKAIGIEIALRTMFPDIIAFDEIATVDELKKVSDSFYSGVNIITTAHIGSIHELKTRSVTNLLLRSGAINQIAILPQLHGGKTQFINTQELFCEAYV